MSIGFILLLISYLAAVCANHATNTMLSMGVLNTTALSVLLYAGMRVLVPKSKSHFFVGFFLFFGGLNALYLVSSAGRPMRDFTLAEPIGHILESFLAGTPIDWSPALTKDGRYQYLSQCFLSTFFGLAGGLTATILNRVPPSMNSQGGKA